MVVVVAAAAPDSIRRSVQGRCDMEGMGLRRLCGGRGQRTEGRRSPWGRETSRPHRLLRRLDAAASGAAEGAVGTAPPRLRG